MPDLPQVRPILEAAAAAGEGSSRFGQERRT